MKKLSRIVALISLFTTGQSFTSTDEVEDHLKFTLSCNALALKPAGDFHYAAEAFYMNPANITPPSLTNNWTIFDLNPHYAFGFELNFAMYIPQLQASILNSYEHFNSIQSNSITAITPAVIGAFFGVGQEQTSTQATTTFTFNFNEYNISYIQPIDCNSQRLTTNVSVGINVTEIKQINNTQFNNATLTNIMIINNPSEFLGAGLRLGTDFSYKLAHGLAFQGKITGALLSGHISNDQSFTITEPAISAATLVIGEQAASNLKQSITIAQRLQVIPSFFERIGLSYEFNKNNSWIIHLEGGYQAQIYLNAIQSTDVSSQIIISDLNHVQNQPAADGASAKSFQRNVSNFALTGPYFNFELQF